jgi:hypothetical protein
MVFPGSRYSNSNIYTVQGPNGTTISVLALPLPGSAAVQGYYRRGGAQRLDVIANAFLQDATAFWRLCDVNNTVLPDALAARALIGIPVTGK